MATPSKSAKRTVAKTAAKKSQRKPRRNSFGVYISRVLKGASKAKLTLSSKSVKILDSLVKDFFDKIAVEAASLARSNKKRTLGSREIQTAVRLVLPAELAKHAMAEGTRAVAKASA
jgi:histone H2B